MSTTSPSLKSEMLCATMWTWYLRRFASPPKRNKSSGAAFATSRKVAKPSLVGKKSVASRLGSSRRSTIYSCYHTVVDTYHSNAKKCKIRTFDPGSINSLLGNAEAWLLHQHLVWCGAPGGQLTKYRHHHSYIYVYRVQKPDVYTTEHRVVG